MGCEGSLGCPSWFVTALGSWIAYSGRWLVQVPAVFLNITLGSSLSLPVLAAGLRWLRCLLGCPPSVASLWRGLPGSLSGTGWLALLVLLCIWTPGIGHLSQVRRRSSSVPDRDVAFPPLVEFAFGLGAVPLPQADAVGFGLCWSAGLSGLLTGRCWAFTLDSSSLAWFRGEPSTVFLLLCLPSGCGHPLGSLVSFVTIDRQRRLPLEGFFFCVVASHLVVLS